MAARITSSSFGATQTKALEDAVSCQPLSSSTSQKETHIDFFLRLIENPSIQSNPSIRVILESQVEELMRQKSQELTTQQEETYAWAKKLLIDQKVSSFVAKKLVQMHAPTLSEQSSPQSSSFRSEGSAVTPETSNMEPPIRVSLKSQVEELMRQKSQELTTQQEETYAWAKKLLIDQKVSSFVAKKPVQMHAPILPEQSSFQSSLFRSEGSAVMLKAFNPEGIAVMAAQSVTTLPTIPFGAAEWKKYFGDVGVEPPLPSDINTILSAPCPFWSGKKVQDTHLLVLVPQTVNGQSLTLKSLGELVKKPLQGTATKYQYFDIGEYTDPAVPKSHWALLTQDVVEGSRNKSYSAQKTLINAPYEVPTILDATVAIFIEHVRTGNRLYSDSPWTYTRCQEEYHSGWKLVVGGYSVAGLDVRGNGGAYSCDGVGGLRKFPDT